MNNHRKINNRGLSMVELIISVTILSIIMAGMAAILSSMTRNFALSQTEIALQDNVQSTYTIVSNLIQEAQTETAKSTDKVVQTVGNRTYIISNNTGNKSQAEYSIIELDSSTNKLYLYHSNLYILNGTNYVKVAYPSDIKQDNNILATDVSAFTVDDSKYNDGYVVLGLKCEKRGRAASITQNVYLRNSNMSAEWGTTKVKQMESDIPEGYHVKSVENVTNSVGSYAKGATVSVTDFTLTGTYVKDDDESVVLPNKTIAKTDIVNVYDGHSISDDKQTINSDVVLTAETDNSTVYFIMVDDNGNFYWPSGAQAQLSVKSGTSFVNKDTDSNGGLNSEDTTNKKTSTNSNIEVSYTVDPGTASRNITATTTYTEDVMVCKFCKMKVIPPSNSWDPYKCNHAGYVAGVSKCKGDIQPTNYYYQANQIDPSNIETHHAGDKETTTEAYTTGTGVITIQNTGTQDIKKVKLIVYVDGGLFVRKSGNFITFKKASNTTMSVEYKSTSSNTADTAQYIELDISKLSAYPGDTRKSDILKINYNWAIPSSAYNAGTRPVVAVFSESHI